MNIDLITILLVKAPCANVMWGSSLQSIIFCTATITYLCTYMFCLHLYIRKNLIYCCVFISMYFNDIEKKLSLFSLKPWFGDTENCFESTTSPLELGSSLNKEILNLTVVANARRVNLILASSTTINSGFDLLVDQH